MYAKGRIEAANGFRMRRKTGKGRIMERKTAVVTGGAGVSAGGSGRYIANKLADEGYYVVIWDIEDSQGIETTELIRKKGDKAIYVHCDVTDEDQIKEAVEKTLEHTGRIDVLVNNAFWHANEQPPLHEVTLEDWDRHISFNLRCHFIVCKYVIPHLIEHPESAIVNISTTASRRGEDGYAAYAAAKAGLESLTRSIAAQYGRDGLRCNCVVPGLVLNTQIEAMIPVVPSLKKQFGIIDRQSLLEGGHGNGMCVADAVSFLASDASRWMTGQCIVLDGGTISHNPAWADGRALAEEAGE